MLPYRMHPVGPLCKVFVTGAVSDYNVWASLYIEFVDTLGSIPDSSSYSPNRFSTAPAVTFALNGSAHHPKDGTARSSTRQKARSIRCERWAPRRC